MIKTNYTINELKVPKNLLKMPLEYQKKTKSQLEVKLIDILSRLDENIDKISFHEKEFAYNFNLSNRISLLKKYDCFFDFYFLEIYAKYRINRNEMIELSHNKTDQVLSKLDAISILDLKYFHNDWNENTIKINYGNPNNLKSSIKRETKDQLKLYLNDLKINNDSSTCNDDILNSEKSMLFLHSKWVYLLSQKIIETYENNSNYYTLKLNSNEIRFTVKSLVHILIRHYSPLSKIAEEYKNEEKCSNHNKNVPFEEIHLILEIVFREIDDSKILEKDFLLNVVKSKKIKKNYITFEFKKNIYRVWMSINKNNNESGKIPFNEIDSFYPLEKEEQRTNLYSNSRKVKINNDLYFFIENE